MKRLAHAFILISFMAVMVLAPSVYAQEKPAPVAIWCQDSSGNFAPCQAGNSIDYDTGGGTVNQGTIGIALPGSGGPVAGGTSTNPIRTDPTGSTTQPVSGTITANVGTTNGLHLDSTFTGRFPAGFSSADNIAAQTATAMHGFLYGWDSGGSNWDRILVTSGAMNVSVQNSTLAVTQSGTWTIQPGNTANTTAWLFKIDQTSTNNDVDVASLPALPAGSNTIGNVGTLPVTSGGTAPCYITSAASTNATNCKASAGQVYSYRLINTTATLYYLRMYNLSSAPTCSSATGFVQTIPIPASTTGGGVVSPLPMGEAYSTGIGFCLTGGGSSTDNTNAATGVYVTVNYK